MILVEVQVGEVVLEEFVQVAVAAADTLEEEAFGAVVEEEVATTGPTFSDYIIYLQIPTILTCLTICDSILELSTLCNKFFRQSVKHSINFAMNSNGWFIVISRR
jgi:hypothetical protein